MLPLLLAEQVETKVLKRRNTLVEKVPSKNSSSLRQACNEFGRQDLYKPLSWVLNLNIKWLDMNLQLLLKKERYVTAACVMLYDSKSERARQYFEKALRSSKAGSTRYRRLTTVLGNLDVVEKIARRSWELDGKYERESTTRSTRRGAVSLRFDGALFTKILVAVDGSRSSERAARVAVMLAKRNAAELSVISAIPRHIYLYAPVPDLGGAPVGLGAYYRQVGSDADKRVNEVVSLAKGQGVKAIGRVLKAASVVQSITDYAKSHGIELIVLGTKGSGGFKRLLLGSVSSGVVTHAHCSVMVVR
jgi:nucleotide-binding universal stress UspA family protein